MIYSYFLTTLPSYKLLSKILIRIKSLRMNSSNVFKAIDLYMIIVLS